MKILLALIAGIALAACKPVEVRLTEIKIRSGGDDRVAVSFKADGDIFQRGLHPFAYLRVEDESWRESTVTSSPGYDCAVPLEKPPRPQPRDGTAEVYLYQCEFPKKAGGKGEYYLVGPDGNRTHFLVERSYDLSQPGEHRLEFYIIGGGYGLFSRGIISDLVALRYSDP